MGGVDGSSNYPAFEGTMPRSTDGLGPRQEDVGDRGGGEGDWWYEWFPLCWEKTSVGLLRS